MRTSFLVLVLTHHPQHQYKMRLPRMKTFSEYQSSSGVKSWKCGYSGGHGTGYCRGCFLVEWFVLFCVGEFSPQTAPHWLTHLELPFLQWRGSVKKKIRNVWQQEMGDGVKECEKGQKCPLRDQNKKQVPTMWNYMYRIWSRKRYCITQGLLRFSYNVLFFSLAVNRSNRIGGITSSWLAMCLPRRIVVR